MLSAKLCGLSGPCFFLVVRCASPRLVKPSSTWRALKPPSSISATWLKSTLGNSFIDWPPKSTLSRYNSTNCTVGTSTRCTPGNSNRATTAIMPISSRNTKNSSSSPASLSSCISSISSPAYNAWATRPSSRHASCQFSRSITALGGLCSSLLSFGAPLLIWVSFFPVPYHLLLLLAPLLDELTLISKHQFLFALDDKCHSCYSAFIRETSSLPGARSLHRVLENGSCSTQFA